MKYFLLPILFALYLPLVQAQNPCGSPSIKSTWLTKYQQMPSAYPLPEEDTILYVPMTVHILGTDAGAGYFRLVSLARAICRLNLDFAQANIQFYIKEPLHYINNTAYNQHETYSLGIEMMLANDVPNTLNTYFSDNAVGNCGYFIPGLSISVDVSCAGPNNHTWAHEIGHAFTLPHTFFGWEGIIYEVGSMAPSIVGNSVAVELLDGSNCIDAADGFCDTPADFLSYRWTCNDDNNSKVLETDPNGETFLSDGSFFMSYSYPNCQSRFSDDQIAAMRSYIYNEHPEYLAAGQIPLPMLSEEAVNLISPIDEALTDPNNAELIWTSAGEDAKYHLKVSKTTNMSYIVVDTIITDTSFVVSNLDDQFFYFWKVLPFNDYSFCTPESVKGKFKADASTVPIFNMNSGSWQLSPTYAAQGSTIQLSGNQPLGTDVTLYLTDISGHVLQRVKLLKGRRKYAIHLSEKIKNGLYFLSGSDNQNWIVREKIIIY